MPSRISIDRLNQLARERILILDGAMGTMIQRHDLTEADYRGDRFAAHANNLFCNHDVLVLTERQIIAAIHRQYLDAGADIITTNTFNANAVSQSAYGLEPLVYEINYEAARIARATADEVTAQWPSKPRLVAGSIGPTNRLVLTTDANDAAPRTITFDDMKAAYLDQVRGLIDGGVDVLLLETIVDAPSANAAIAAIDEVRRERGVSLPLMLSFVVIDRGDPTPPAQLVDQFYRALEHARPWSIGINCGVGAQHIRPHLAELARVAGCWVSAHPSAGLPNSQGQYDQPPAETAALLADFAAHRFVNVLGGCCGTTSDHIRLVAESVKDLRPRVSAPAASTSTAGALLSLDQARANSLRSNWDTLPVPVPWFVGHRIISDQRLEDLVPHLDGINLPREQHDTARAILSRIVKERKLQARAVYGFWPANAVGDDIVVYRDDGRKEELARFPMLRQQEPTDQPNRSLADFIAPVSSLLPDYIGVFALTAGIGVDALVGEYEAQHDSLSVSIVRLVADRLAAAFAEFLQKQAREEWGFGSEIHRGIRIALGDPACPDRSQNAALFKLLGAPNLGITLSDTFTVEPPASRSGIYFSHPDAKAFSLGRIGSDQLEDYAERRGVAIDEAARWLGANLQVS